MLICFEKFKLYANLKKYNFFVFKKDKLLRFCVNYKVLNSIIIKNKYLLFLINKTSVRLIGVYFFMKLNLKDAYYCL